MMFDDEDEAFRSFLRVFPDSATLLVDTYDTEAAVTRLANDFESKIMAVRLDSGDLADLSIKVRDILDRAGKTDTRIFASSDLDEYRISELISQGARIDAFGVGTQLATSYDAPALSGVYKLVASERDGRIRMRIKLSTDKATYPGPKQVWRCIDESGSYSGDIVALEDEPEPRGGPGNEHHSSGPLLEHVMIGERDESGGYNHRLRRQASYALLEQARNRAGEELKRLPPALLDLETDAQYPVSFSERIRSEMDKAKSDRQKRGA